MNEANLKRLHAVGCNYVAFRKRQNCGDSEKVGGCQEFGGERHEEVEHLVTGGGGGGHTLWQ